MTRDLYPNGSYSGPIVERTTKVVELGDALAAGVVDLEAIGGHSGGVPCQAAIASPARRRDTNVRRGLRDRAGIIRRTSPGKDRDVSVNPLEQEWLERNEPPGQSPCRPNGFWFCSEHPTCDHVTNTVREAQVKAQAAVDCVRHECQKSWLEGYLAGLEAYAWWNDGVQYVGSCGKTLADAIAEAREGVDASA